MKLTLLSSVLLLGATEARGPEVFGRSMRKQSSPPNPKAAKKEVFSIFFAGEDAAKAAKKDVIKLLQTKTSKTPKIVKARKTYSSPDLPGPRRWTKTSKQSSDWSENGLPLEDSMSYDFAPTDDMTWFDPSGLASFSYGFSMPDAVTPPTTAAPPKLATQEATPSTSTSEDTSTGLTDDFGRLIFEYLSQCAGLPLATDTCLVSKTIDVFMNMEGPEDGLNGRQRFLQASKGGRARFLQALSEPTEDICGPPEITRQNLTAVMSVTKEQCEDSGIDVSDGEFNEVLGTFTRLFSNTGCWETLCDEDTTSALFFKIFFDEAAKCANGEELNVHKCVEDHIIELVLNVDDPTANRVRRVLQSDPCDTPSEADLSFLVSFMLIDAEAKCSGMDVSLENTDWSAVSYNLVSIFMVLLGLSEECGGMMGGCEEDQESIGNTWPTEFPVFDDEEDSRFGITDDGQQCIFEIDTDPELERTLEIPFFYRVETTSDGEFDLRGIEGALINIVCSDGRRTRALSEESFVVVALDSAPEDVVSTDHTCSAENPEATSCHIVEGKVTLIIEGENTEYDEEIEMEAYIGLEALFANLPYVLSDSNIVDVKYIGAVPPSAEAPEDTTTKDVPEDEPTIGKLNSEDIGDDSFAYTALLVAASGSLVAIALLVTGFKRMNKRKEEAETQDPVHLDDKSHGSNDGQSTAYQTADLTYAHSCDQSDISSLPSPARSLGGFFPASHRGSPDATRVFILAEEEEENWRELSILPSILPALAHDDGTLEGVSEEGSFISATDSDSSGTGEMSV